MKTAATLMFTFPSASRNSILQILQHHGKFYSTTTTTEVSGDSKKWHSPITTEKPARTKEWHYKDYKTIQTQIFGGPTAENLTKEDFLVFNRLCSEGKWDMQNFNPRAWPRLRGPDRKVAWDIYNKLGYQYQVWESKFFPFSYFNGSPWQWWIIIIWRCTLWIALLMTVPKLYEMLVPEHIRCKYKYGKVSY